MRNTNVGFQSLAITLETKAVKQIKNVDRNNLRAKRAEKSLRTVVRSVRKTVQIFFCISVNFCTLVL